MPEVGGVPSLEVLNDRWAMVTIAPWRGGSWSKDGLRLHDAIENVAQRMAMLEGDEFIELGCGEFVSEAEDAVRRVIIRRLHEGGLARSGYQDIGVAPEPVR